MHSHIHAEFEFFSILLESITITMIIFLLMILVEILELKYSKLLKKYLTKNFFFQNIISCFLGATPGCAGMYLVDSFYMAGIVGFGSIIAATITTFGDEAFVIFAMNPQIALKLILITSLLGFIGGYIAVFIQKTFKIKLEHSCCIKHHEDDERKHKINIKHFLTEHIWTHIFKKHIIKIFIWIFVSLFIIGFLNEHIHLAHNLHEHKLETMLIAALVGLLPISGPNIFFITLFMKGEIAFSILLVNSIIQDGHGLLPILGYSLNDALKIKVFNIIYGLSIGLILFVFNL